MRVTLISQTDKVMPSGIGTYVRNMVRELRPLVELDHHVILKSELAIGRLRVGGLVTPILRANFAPLGRGSDVVHASDISVLHPRADVMTLMDLIPVKWPGYPNERIMYRLLRRRVRGLRRIITLSRYVADEASEVFDVDRDRFAPIHLAVDHDAFKPEPTTPPHVRPGAVNLFYAGDLRPRKRFDLLVRALSHLPGARLVRAGPPPLGNASIRYAARCAALAKELGVDVVDAGYVPMAQLRGYYSHCDLFVFPSLDEGFGLPPLEAMACGANVLLSDIPPHREVCGDRASYIPDETPEGVADAVQNALKRPRPKADLVAHARTFTWARTAKETVAVYEDVAA